MDKIYLSLGGNNEETLDALKFAKDLLGEFGVRILRESSIYKTEPWGFEDQPWFWNQVLECTSYLSPEILLRTCNEIEKKFRRDRRIKNGPRILDIDILLYENEIVDTETLVIPHEAILDRNFVLIPLNELASDLIHPVYLETISNLLARCTDKLEVAKI